MPLFSFRDFRKRASESLNRIYESSTFYVYRTDTNAVLARGIKGYEAAKDSATMLRQRLGLKWDQVKFKMERDKAQKAGVGGASASPTKSPGWSRRIDYSPRFNPSKGRRFRGYYDQDGNYHDLD